MFSKRFGLTAAALISFSVMAVAAELPIPKEIYGNYAPGGNCRQEPRVVVNNLGTFIENQGKRTGPLPVSVCYSCAGGAQYDGIQRWLYVKYGTNKGGNNMPVILMFNADEKLGSLKVDYDKSTHTPLGAPMQAVVKASSFNLCSVRNSTLTAVPTHQSAASTPRSLALAVTTPLTPAAGFANTIRSLMQPSSVIPNTFYGWQDIETSTGIRWAPLPPTMLDKPTADGHYFRRTGVLTVGGQPIKVIAAGARTMVMAHYFKNEGKPIGEEPLLSALRQSGLTVTTARCPIQKTLMAPKWYRLSGAGKQPAFLWIAPSRGTSQPWEGFSLTLSDALKPLSPREQAVYTDHCP